MAVPWADLPIGEETGRVQFLVTEQMIDDYIAAMEIEQSGHSSMVVPALSGMCGWKISTEKN